MNSESSAWRKGTCDAIVEIADILAKGGKNAKTDARNAYEEWNNKNPADPVVKQQFDTLRATLAKWDDNKPSACGLKEGKLHYARDRKRQSPCSHLKTTTLTSLFSTIQCMRRKDHSPHQMQLRESQL